MDNNNQKKAEFLCLVIITIIISFFIVKNINYEKFQQVDGMAETINAFALEETPKYFYFTKDTNKKPTVLAGSYIVGDATTNEIIFTKNQDDKFPIASITKLMTAIISKENQNPEKLIQISKKVLATEGKNGNLLLNEKIKISDILYPLLLESSNDAAEALALHYGRDIFIEKMNEKAKDLDMDRTFFEDPSGLSPNNKSTALDLFKLAKYIKEQHPDLFKITTNQSYKKEDRVWSSNNQFLHTDGYIGGKSGYTNESKQTVISLLSLPLGKSDNRVIAIILLHSEDRVKDIENILKHLKKNVYYGTEFDALANWVKEKIGMTEVDNSDFITLAFIGDIMLDRGIKNSVKRNFGGDYGAFLGKLTILKNYDIVFANLEGTASDKGEDFGNLYSFRMDPSIVPALKGTGIDILSVANNHVGDWGRIAYLDTLSRLKENEILYTGGGNNLEEAKQPVIIEKYGMKIGFLGFSDKGPDWMKADKENAGILLASNPDLDEIIKNASGQVDYLVVSFHFGEEYQTKHDKRQEELAHRAIDNGAKIVIGTHPHVIEDMEVYKNSYIAYSLGNFIFDQGFSANTMRGMLLGIKLNKDGSMSAIRNIIQLNKLFQPDKIIKGKEEKIKF